MPSSSEMKAEALTSMSYAAEKSSMSLVRIAVRNLSRRREGIVVAEFRWRKEKKFEIADRAEGAEDDDRREAADEVKFRRARVCSGILKRPTSWWKGTTELVEHEQLATGCSGPDRRCR